MHPMNRALPPSCLKVILLHPHDRRAAGPARVVATITHEFTAYPR